MGKTTSYTLFLAALVLAIALGDARPERARAQSGAADFLPGLILVGLRPGAALDSVLSGAEAHTASSPGFNGERPLELRREARDRLPQLGVYGVRTAPGQEEAALQALLADPGVAFAERDVRVQVAPLAALPNDPGLRYQWGLEKIGAPGAWALEEPAKPAVIAILDSGLQLDHPDLAPNLWTNPGEIPANDLDDDGNGWVDDVYGWRFERYYDTTVQTYVNAGSNDVQDDFGHGTHVAGIAAAAADNGEGAAGVAPRAQLMTVKVLDDTGAGWYSDIADGILYAADNGADVINLSLGAAYPSGVLERAAAYARERGVVIVAAAGNTSGPVLYPAALPDVLAVAASDQQDEPAVFSSYGPQVDLAAPGVNIYSTWYNGGYLTQSGTSMAAPHVAGTAALLRAARPDLGPAEITALLTGSTDDLAGPGYDQVTGWGRLNAHRALVQVSPEPDLWIRLRGPVFAPSGEITGYTVEYGNRGGGTAAGVRITGEGPASFNLAPVAWTIEELAPGGETQVQIIQVEGFDPGTVIHLSATIASDSQESLTENNMAEASITFANLVYLPWMGRGN